MLIESFQEWAHNTLRRKDTSVTNTLNLFLGALHTTTPHNPNDCCTTFHMQYVQWERDVDTNDSTCERQYSSVHRTHPIPVNQSFHFKPMPNYIYDSLKSCHTEADWRQEEFKLNFLKKSLMFLPPNHFCIIMPTVTRSFYHLVAFSCISFIIICTIPS